MKIRNMDELRADFRKIGIALMLAAIASAVINGVALLNSLFLFVVGFVLFLLQHLKKS